MVASSDCDCKQIANGARSTLKSGEAAHNAGVEGMKIKIS